MTITSLSFGAAVAIAFVLYYLFPQKFRWIVLLGMTVTFFVCNSSWKLLVVTLIPVMVAYVAALGIDLLQNKELVKWAKAVFVATILVEVGLLIWFKEINFFIYNGNRLLSVFHVSYQMEIITDIIAPIGISYFTLTLLGYVIDVYWRTYEPQKNPLKLILFSLYFPTLTSGPIIRYQEMEQTNLFSGNRFDYQNMCFGLQRIVWGLLKKMVLAERLSVIVTTIQVGEYYGAYIFFAVVCRTLQVYMDFSGCMDMVLGVSQLFGVTLPENFDAPLFARDLSEFWRRWHITLGGWVRDYIMYPLLKSSGIQKLGKKCKKRFGKELGKKIPSWVCIFPVWLTVGFWHGGQFTFICGSGLFFFAAIVIGQMLEPVWNFLIRLLHIKTESFLWKTFQRIRTLVLFSMISSFSWASTLGSGFAMWKRGFSAWNPEILWNGSILELGLDWKDMLVLGIGLLVILLVSNLQQKKSLRERVAELPLPIRWALYLLLVAIVLIFAKYGPGYEATTFIYGQF